MKIVLLLWLSLAALAFGAGEKFPILTTTAGKEYKDVVVKTVEIDGIKITHAAGVTKIPFEQLPAEFRKQFEKAIEKVNEVETAKVKATAIEAAQPWWPYAQACDSNKKTPERRAEMRMMLPILKDLCSVLTKSDAPDLEKKKIQLREWSELAANEKIIEGMLEPFVIFAWGNPRKKSTFSGGMTMYHYGALSESQTVTIRRNIVDAWSSYE